MRARGDMTIPTRPLKSATARQTCVRDGATVRLSGLQRTTMADVGAGADPPPQDEGDLSGD